MNAESPCVSRDQPEKKAREKKRNTGDLSFFDEVQYF